MKTVQTLSNSLNMSPNMNEFNCNWESAFSRWLFIQEYSQRKCKILDANVLVLLWIVKCLHILKCLHVSTCLYYIYP